LSVRCRAGSHQAAAPGRAVGRGDESAVGLAEFRMNELTRSDLLARAAERQAREGAGRAGRLAPHGRWHSRRMPGWRRRRRAMPIEAIAAFIILCGHSYSTVTRSKRRARRLPDSKSQFLLRLSAQLLFYAANLAVHSLRSIDSSVESQAR
jgi:hypothetical protein